MRNLEENVLWNGIPRKRAGLEGRLFFADSELKI